MRKFYTTSIYLFLLSIITIYCNAQIVITKNSLPQIGDETTTFMYNSDGRSEGPAGTDKVWDFSDLTKSNGPFTTKYISPATTENPSEFPNANLAGIDPINPGVVQYITSTDNVYQMVGLIATQQSSSTITKYSDPQIEFTLPFSYNSVVNDEFKATSTNDDIPAYLLKRSGTSRTTADGTGTLILPGGKSFTALRIKAEQHIEDVYETIDDDTLKTINITNSTSYSWVVNEYKGPVLTFHYISSGSIFISNGDTLAPLELTTQTAVVGIDPIVASIASPFLSGNAFEITLNPVEIAGSAMVESKNNQSAEMSIKSIEGSIVKTLGKFELQAGSNVLNFDCNHLAAGIYLLEISTLGNKAVRKFIKK